MIMQTVEGRTHTLGIVPVMHDETSKERDGGQVMETGGAEMFRRLLVKIANWFERLSGIPSGCILSGASDPVVALWESGDAPATLFQPCGLKIVRAGVAITGQGDLVCPI